MKTYQIIFMGLLLALMNVTDAFAGRRVGIWTLNATERTTLRNAIMAYLNSDTNGNSDITTSYNIVNIHADNDAYIHNYNENFLGWHRLYLQGMEAYVMANISSTLRNKINNLLPYWDPATSIPGQFSGSAAVLTGFTAIERTNPIVQTNGAYNFSRFTGNNQYTFYRNYNDGATADLCGDQTGTRTRPIDRFAADLECEHNTVHGAVGGVMANPQQSPAAAVFWIWHAYVDEIYWDYETSSGKYAGPAYNAHFDTVIDDYWYLGGSNKYSNIQLTTDFGPMNGGHITMDSNTNNNYTTNEAILNLNLQGLTNVTTYVWWKHFSDEVHAQDGIYFSNGGPFVKVQDFPFSTTGADLYRLIPIDVSSLAAGIGMTLTNTFKIKFQQYDNYGITTDGMALENVSVIGRMSSGTCTSFETGLDGWYNLDSDALNWTRYSGATPSVNTGPGGTSSGNHYMYLEASSPNYPSKTGSFVKHVRNANLNTISFEYHMYGNTMGSLILGVSESDSGTYQQLWSSSGDQGNQWLYTTVTIPQSYLSGGYYLRFIGTTGSNYLSDMAIDNVCFSSFSVSRSATNDVIPEELTPDLRGYPNPFSQSTTIEYTLTEATEVVLTVTDVTGREIKKLVNGASQQPGVHQVIFNAENIPDGVYLYTLDAQGTRKTAKLILQR